MITDYDYPNSGRHTKFHLYFILFVYTLLVHCLVGHIPNIDCVICLWLWNIVVMILVTINEEQQVLSLQKLCSVDIYTEGKKFSNYL